MKMAAAPANDTNEILDMILFTPDSFTIYIVCRLELSPLMARENSASIG
jgi:hypothetical protein